MLFRVPKYIILQWAFKLYDKDGGGEIDISEMVEAVGTLHAMSAVESPGEADLAGREALQIDGNTA